MDFRRLEVFQKVFELRSFSRAGQVLLLAQPTVSEHIRLLEEDLKLTLLDRQGREVVPTKAGELLYGYSKQLTGLRQETLRAMQQFLDKGRGELLIGGSNIPGQYLLPVILGKFKEKYPHVRVQVLIDDTRNMVEKVLAGAIELGVVGARVEQRQISCTLLTKDELVGIQPANFPAGQKKPLDPRQLLSLPFIMRERGSGTRRSIETALEKIGLNPDELLVVAELGSSEAVRQAVKAGLGVSIISRRSVEEDLAAGLVKEFKVNKFPLYRNFYLLYRKQRTLSPLAEEFKDFLLAESRGEKAEVRI
jgi:DNA-binding transcriptional LysR family regulator